MKLIEIRDAGHRYARKPAWHPYSGLEMPPKVTIGGRESFGPWCKMIDRTGPAAGLPEVQEVPWWQADDGLDDWEPMEPMESIPELPTEEPT